MSILERFDCICNSQKYILVQNLENAQDRPIEQNAVRLSLGVKKMLINPTLLTVTVVGRPDLNLWYILSNHVFPDCVKIGYTRLSEH